MSVGTRRFALKKVLELFLTLFIVTIISFVLMRVAPIGPAEAYARRGTITDPVKIAQIKEDMGLTRLLFEQYIDWVKDVMKLDFGKSYVSSRSVFTDVTTALAVTAIITVISAVIQAAGVLLIGCLCYWSKGRWFESLIDLLCIVGISIPAFFLATTFIDVFAVKYSVISVAGNTGVMRYLPAAICLSVSGIAFFGQLLANNMQKSMESDSAFYARCRGLTERRIMLHHALPQAVVGILPNFMQMIGLCMAGATIVENIFSLPGLGYRVVQSVLQRDAPMIHATILFLAFALVICNIISDILQRALQGGSAMKEGEK